MFPGAAAKPPMLASMASLTSSRVASPERGPRGAMLGAAMMRRGMRSFYVIKVRQSDSWQPLIDHTLNILDIDFFIR